MKLIHLSDLHFGTEQQSIVGELQSAIKNAQADLVVISGDFTQIANAKEFQAARTFLESLSTPVLCVPGNHDIPRFNLWERFVAPYKKYKTFIHDDLCPHFEYDDVIIAGINSARKALPHWNWANGAISQAQLNHVADIYDQSPAKRRVCVFHHPIHKALNGSMKTTVFGAQRALAQLNEMEVDLVLTGHVHHASVTTLGDIDHKTVYLSASTATSSRLRKQVNGFNLIDITEDMINIDIYTHTGQNFEQTEHYQQGVV